MNYARFVFLFFLSFVVFISILGYKAMQTNFDLVAPDYYAKELKFQQIIDATKNAASIKEKVSVQYAGGSVSIQFPDSMKGTPVSIHFYCPAEAKNDQKYTSAIGDSGRLVLETPKLKKGYYKVNMEWKGNEKEYYLEKNLMIYP